MGSTPFGDAGLALVELVTPQDIKAACGSQSCAVGKDPL